MPRLSKIGAAALAAFGWTGQQSVTVSYLVLAGGGASGNLSNFSGGLVGGGGGAGGLLTGTVSLNTTLSFTVTVGAGGTGTANPGGNGSDSSFTGLTTAVGGGGGGGVGAAGVAGGSGGGAGGHTLLPAAAGGAGTSGQGNAGGGSVANNRYGGSGGGAGGAGVVANGSGTGLANSGAGTASSITGSSVTYATGGSSGFNNNAGGANTGGGGNSLNIVTSQNGSSGGSGIVIISYVGAQQFSGGVVTSSGGSTIHTFTTSGTLGPITTLSASYLIVAGGAGAGGGNGGGGGAGGLLSGSGVTIDSSSTYLVTVGAGGAGAAATIQATGTSGGNSAFSMVTTTAVGGGAGGTGYGSGAWNSGLSGGSGGGGGANNGTGGTATSGQGNAGAAGGPGGGGPYYGSGGGGSGGAGAVGTAGNGGYGGVATANSISGTSTYYAGGGGGGSGTAAGAGTSGGLGGGTATTAQKGGAADGSTSTTVPSNATANTGGGGGGGGYTGGANAGAGSNGGSGVVIIAYAGATQLMAGGTVTISGGNVIHTFTSTGFLAPIELVNNSLRFRSSASAYLNRTPTVSGNQQKFTFSYWFKRGTLSAEQVMFGLNSASNEIFTLAFLSGNTFRVFGRNGGTDVLNLTTTALYRDPAAWYHIFVAIDTTQATSSNRALLYINGVQVTAFGTSTYPAQNTSLAWNSSSYAHNIGREPTGNYIDGYLTEVNFIDGQALTPSSFGTTNSYGVWQPITYGGSYGTNGFYLPFTNTTSTTTLGYDFSPQGNNWTTNNISLTAGTTYDSMTDVPTLTSATAANYCVMNPLKLQTNMRLTNGNLDVSSTDTGSAFCAFGSIVMSSGSWYAEYTINTSSGNYPQAGIGDLVKNPNTNEGLGDSNGTAYQRSGLVVVNNSTIGTFATFTNGDVIGVAYDANNNRIYFAKNNTWINSGNPSGGTGYFSPASPIQGYVFGTSTYSVGSCSINFGQRPFTYTPPSGFVALNTYNL